MGGNSYIVVPDGMSDRQTTAVVTGLKRGYKFVSLNAI